MLPLVEIPDIVQHYAPFFGHCSKASEIGIDKASNGVYTTVRTFFLRRPSHVRTR
jgi:hypothetical protein